MDTAADFYSQIIFDKETGITAQQRALLDATSDCIKLITTDGTLLFMNRSGCLALGVPFDSEFGMPWLSLLPPEVHEAGMRAIETASAGHSATLMGMSDSPDGMVYWDNLLTPILDQQGVVTTLLCVSRNVTETKRLENQLREAIAREQHLAQEMRHRIKNVFTVVSGLITIAKREALSSGDTFTPEALQEKLSSLARASEAVFIPEAGEENDTRPVDISTVAVSVLEPYIGKCRIGENEAFIHPGEVTSIALLLHELATNSVKYGALGAINGKVTVDWKTDSDMIKLTWTETGGPAILQPPATHGFGTAMVDRVIRAAKGEVERRWTASGLIVGLTFPGFKKA